ncbi:hypothetical protein NGF19_17510 [Streptomyces sp. RY43-2]|uniref:Uncharacterized protein n=1 Tax=Streptomyces macrolidinus TaxID=2952607 RepID=A0ABT0ZG89_9ACTN|nr:hypothetical protein [Streptomyces macrolidinus]MCN9242573.1 hypothetical protein [Streptomyces macrolidinus]
MSDPSSRAPAPEPDFLDRLLARHAAAAPDTARLRPRLPGPFERVEAVRARAPEPDVPDAAAGTPATFAVLPDRDGPRPPAEIRRHTEHQRTVVHTEPPFAATESVRPAPAATLPEAPLLRPAAPFAAGPLPVSRATPRDTGRSGPDAGADRVAASAPTPLGADAAPAAVVSTAPHPSPADTTAARAAAARQASARRPGRTPEQVVHVQIGRLEVTTRQKSSVAGQVRQDVAQRPGATLGLAEYLARGRK